MLSTADLTDNTLCYHLDDLTGNTLCYHLDDLTGNTLCYHLDDMIDNTFCYYPTNLADNTLPGDGDSLKHEITPLSPSTCESNPQTASLKHQITRLPPSTCQSNSQTERIVETSVDMSTSIQLCVLPWCLITCIFQQPSLLPDTTQGTQHRRQTVQMADNAIPPSTLDPPSPHPHTHWLLWTV